jgi:hypothetical protein
MGSKFTEVMAREPAPEWFTGIVSRWNSHGGSCGYILRDSDGLKVIAYTRDCPGDRLYFRHDGRTKGRKEAMA